VLPRITIVTPSFNQAAYLAQTLRSVLEQGYPDLEYLVLDGGSTDGSRALIERHAGRLAFWRSEKDAGQAAAIREGFARATGDVLAWINSDDWYEPGALLAVGEAFARGGAEIVHGSVRFVDAQGKRLWDAPLVLDERILAWESEYPAQPALFFSRALYEKAGGVDPSFRFAMDYDLLVRMVRAGGRGRKLWRTLASFRLHPTSKTSTLAQIGAQEVARVRAREGWDRGSAAQKLTRRWSARLSRMARDPRLVLTALESRLKAP
jgi:glycosyltransferase involved in cell wall biosynthesis